MSYRIPDVHLLGPIMYKAARGNKSLWGGLLLAKRDSFHINLISENPTIFLNISYFIQLIRQTRENIKTQSYVSF